MRFKAQRGDERVQVQMGMIAFCLSSPAKSPPGEVSSCLRMFPQQSFGAVASLQPP
jgi:hypothetical protein